MNNKQAAENAPTTLVVIGASAGGLDPLRRLLRRLPLDTGAAIVFIQHLPAAHNTHMPGLLATETKLPVVLLTPDTAPQANTVYVVPPGQCAGIRGRRFVLSQDDWQGHHPSTIDHLMSQVAAAYGSRTIGILLSGAGHDGVRGLERIRRSGGHVLVQAPEHAEHDSMPRAACARLTVDMVGDVRDLATAVTRYSRRQPIPGASGAGEEVQSAHGECEPPTPEWQSSNEARVSGNAELERRIAELEHANNELAQRLQAAAVFLDPADDRMIHLQRMATLGEVVSNLTHEIRQPLAAISNYASVLMRQLHATPAADQTLPIVTRIEEQTRRANQIVTRTREFVGRGNDSLCAFDIQALVETSLSLIEKRKRELNVDVHIEAAMPLPALHGNPVQIEQVLVNLLHNALNAMEANTGERRIAIRIGRRANGGVRLQIEDTGPGIAPEQLTALLNSYQTAGGNGMGLGLPISRTLAAKHGGTLWAESGHSPGACFVLDLPATVP
jgi:signal transduction histidine kinase